MESIRLALFSLVLGSALVQSGALVIHNIESPGANSAISRLWFPGTGSYGQARVNTRLNALTRRVEHLEAGHSHSHHHTKHGNYKHGGVLRPIGYWSLDKANRGRDATRGRHTASLHHVRYTRGPFGRKNGAVKLSGRSNSYISINNRDRGLTVGREISYFVWVRPASSGGRGALFEYYDHKKKSIGVHQWIWRTATSLWDNIGVKGIPWVNVHRVVRPGRWQFIGMTYSSVTGVQRTWVNGRAVRKTTVRGSPSIKSSTNMPVIYIGRRPRMQYLKGSVACAQLYNYALTQRQVKRAMSMCK